MTSDVRSVRPRLWRGASSVGGPIPPALDTSWRVAAPGPLGYHPSFGAPRELGPDKSAAQLFHSSHAVAQAEALLTPAEPLEAATRFALDRLLSHSFSGTRAAWAAARTDFDAAASRLRPVTRAWLHQSPPHVASVLRAASPSGVHLALLDWACCRADIVDGPALISDLRRGFPLVGDVPVDPLATAKRVKAASLTPSEVLQRAPALAASLAARAARSTRHPEFGEGDSAEIWEATLVEVRAGRISAPAPWARARHDLPICRRFGVRQLTSTGVEKLRVIDDFAENEVNDSVTISARIRMSSLLGLRALARRFHAAWPTEQLLLLKADFKSAYRCVPIRGDHLVFARLLLVDPSDGSLHVAHQWAMPFGAIGAVYAWDRLGSVVTQILARLFWLPMLRYVDDLFTVVPATLGPAAFDLLHHVVATLGLVLDPAKSPPPAPSGTVLGVAVACSVAVLTFRVDSAKVEFWITELTRLAADGPSRRPLVKLAGRLSFGCFAVWGPRATARLVPIFRSLRGAAPRASSDLTDCFLWWIAFLRHNGASSTAFTLRPATRPPCVLYTDAEGAGGLGACLYRDDRCHWWQARAPAFVRALAPKLGYPRGMPVFLYEAAAPFVAARTWPRLLTGRRLLLFVDNLTLKGALVKGRSKACPALNFLVNRLLAYFHDLGVTVTVFWVPSRFNVADPASRGDTPPGFGPAEPPPSKRVWNDLRASFTSFA